MSLRESIATWLCPELAVRSRRLYCLKSEILGHRAWLSEFPEVFETMQRLLDIDQAKFGDQPVTNKCLSSMWDFRDGLRRNKEKQCLPHS